MEETNPGRQKETDMAKGFAIIFMIWVHVLLECTAGHDLGVWPMLVDDIFGGPFAAPVFMVCLGIGICYSRNATPGALARRGVRILVTGFVLNVIRFLIPDIITGYLRYGRFCPEIPFDDMVNCDILMFAGLAFIAFAVLKKLNVPDTGLLIVGIGASVLGTCIRWMNTGIPFLDNFLGFIWGTGRESYFPLLTWFLFPVFGYLFGRRIRRCSDKKTFYLLLAPVCLVTGIAYVAVCERYRIGIFSQASNYYYMGTADAAFICVLTVGVFGFDYALAAAGKKVSVKFSFFDRISRNINSIYCIHWTLIGIFGILQEFVLKKDSLSFGEVTVLSLVLLILSDIFAEIYRTFKEKRKARRQQ